MNIAKTVKTNLSRFMPHALKRRYGRAADNMAVRPGMRVVVTDEEGEEVLARVVEQLGNLVRVELLHDGKIEEIEPSVLRRAPRRRRAAVAKIAPETSAEAEPHDAE
jgi:hypothetical protein